MRLVCVVEAVCTSACELEMLGLIFPNWDVSGPATMSNLPGDDESCITYGPEYLRLVELDMKRAQASAWPCCSYPLRLHPLIVTACSVYH